MVTFNAVGNELTGKILKAMPDRGTIFQYSNISLKPLGEFMPEEFLFKEKTLRGFWLTKYLTTLPENEVAELRQSVADDLAPNGKRYFATPVQMEFPLEKYEDARKRYLKNMIKGKVLLNP